MHPDEAADNFAYHVLRHEKRHPRGFALSNFSMKHTQAVIYKHYQLHNSPSESDNGDNGMLRRLSSASIVDFTAYDDVKHCLKPKGYRNNPCIEEAIEFVLLELDRVIHYCFKQKIKITIIDAHTMIKSRLGFNEDNEVVCNNHYITRALR